MELTELYEMQKSMDARIIKEHALEGQDLLPGTVLALQVEIGELANEWRGFKVWSHRQTPKMHPQETCDYCCDEVDFTRPTPFMADVPASMCKNCWDMTQKEYAASNGEHIGDFADYPHFPKKVPQKMLEEYADCLSFFLSIASQLGLPADDLYCYDNCVEGETSVLFTEIMHGVGMIVGDRFLHKPEDNFSEHRKHFFKGALFAFYALGEQRLGFTFEQICEAYVAKNKVNHDRQANGY